MYVLLFLLALVSPQGTDSQFEMLTQERISMLPEGERRAWTDYLVRSQQLADKEGTAHASRPPRVGPHDTF